MSPTTTTAPPWYLTHARWVGAGVGIAIALFDTFTMRALGIAFAINGRDVSLLVAATFGSSLAVLGYLFGRGTELRRREQRQSAVIRAQEEEIAGARARLAQSEKLAALGQLSASIAHEVRNPLAVIRSAAQSLAENVAAADVDGQRACRFITAEIDRLTSVVGSLLAFARPLRLDPRPVKVEELFDGALLLAGPDLTRQQVRVARSAAAATLRVRADVDLVRQVLVGLLVNAIEAVGRDGEVSLDARPLGDAIEIEVADSGPGVPRELQARIFEPFFTTRARGTGLGLPIARQIVEAHGGRLDVGERRGGGARFTVRLPAAPAAAMAA
jgi:signal transduction histidine kinase